VPYEELGAEYTTVDSDEDLGDRGGQDFENQLRREGSEKFCWGVSRLTLPWTRHEHTHSPILTARPSAGDVLY
jgi:hypothetical protein